LSSRSLAGERSRSLADLGPVGALLETAGA
jgi:hypothetical protein